MFFRAGSSPGGSNLAPSALTRDIWLEARDCGISERCVLESVFPLARSGQLAATCQDGRVPSPLPAGRRQALSGRPRFLGWDLARAEDAALTTKILVSCAVIVFVADAVLWLTAPPLQLDALADEPAHAATALLALGVVGYVFSRRFVIAVLAGATLIDVDHIPGMLGWHGLEHAGTRPYPHTLLAPLVVLCAAGALRGRTRQVLLGICLGLVCHFARDIAEPQRQPGVALLWPLSDQHFVIPYIWYGIVIAAVTALGVLRRTRTRWSVARKRGPLRSSA